MNNNQAHLLIDIAFRYTFQTVELPDGSEHTIRRLESSKTWILFPTIAGDKPIYGEWETVPEVSYSESPEVLSIEGA